MANNRIQVKRTSVAGRTANTTDSGNSQYIAAGEFALNMPDGILYTSNGSVLITVGSNVVNQNITGNLTVKAIIANNSIGSAGQTLTSNGSAVYWSTGAGSGTVTQVSSGNGLTGGPITTSGTISILANTGVVANATGLFVNATYIGTLTANNATNLNGQAASFYTNATNITSGTLPYAQIPANIVNTTGSFTLSGVTTFGANVVLGSSGLSANGGFGTAGQVLHSNGTAAYWAADDNAGGTVTSVASGNGITGGTITTTGTLTAVAGAGVVVNASGINVLANNGITANSTGTFVNAQTPLVANATGLHIATSAGNGTFSSGISAITVDSVGRVTSVTGSAGYVTSSGVTSVATGNGMTGGTITTTGTVSILANTGIVANSTGAFVNAAYIATIAANSATGSLTNTFTVGTASYFVANGNLGVGTSTPATKLTVNPRVIDDNNVNYDSNTVYFTHQSPTGTATLNDPKPVLLLARQGTSGQAYGAAAEFNLSRYENASVNSRTRLDIRLADGSFLTNNTTVLTALSNGNIGIGNTAPAFKLRVEGTTSLAGAVSDITTLAAGNTTITGFANVTSTIQGGSSLAIAGALSGVTTAAMGNTTITGFANVTTSVNSALLTVGAAFIANTTGVYHTGVVNAASHTVGSTFIANTSQLTTTVPFSANGSTGTAGQVLTSNGATGSPYWAAAAGGGYYKGGSAAVGTLAVGGQNLFRVNANTLNYNTTIAAGENAQATGPIAVASGITLTVESGARVAIV